MKTIFDHIERVKAQPHHIRRQVAFASAAVGTMLVAVVWFVGSLATGAFAITDSSFAARAEQAGAAPTAAASQGLAGVGAAAALPQSADAPARIEIVDASPAASPQKQAERTTIPF